MKLKKGNLGKSYLIYGLGKSGISSFKYLNQKNRCFVMMIIKKNNRFKKHFISKSKLTSNNFDNIIISPGINIINVNCLII